MARPDALLSRSPALVPAFSCSTVRVCRKTPQGASGAFLGHEGHEGRFQLAWVHLPVGRSLGDLIGLDLEWSGLQWAASRQVRICGNWGRWFRTCVYQGKTAILNWGRRSFLRSFTAEP